MRIEQLPPDRWERIDALFTRALELVPRERPAFLDRTCGEDTELRLAVEVLLATDAAAESALGERADDFAGGLVRDLAAELSGDASASPTDGDDGLPPATLVGPYRILSELGRGGMGRVYLAERADRHFEKKVALKLVKRGMDSEEVLARFRQERQILASLEHPGIARLLDGGLTEDGRPWLAMEHVDGLPVDRWCTERRLGVEARLNLFVQVCDAVQHAHRRLVVHRDIKPSNVLVTEDGEPRLVDFGIAKLLDDDRALRTRTGVRALTPELAAPEQLRGEPVGPATDVHGLGSLLYELLTGTRPWEGRRRTGDAARDPAPDLPSRAAGDPVVGRRLRGDLDVVVLRALHPDPERRYDSAGELAEDVRRHLAGRPVVARPDSLGYRLGKFVGRNRAGVAAAAVAVLALAGAGGVTLGERAERAREERAALAVSGFMENLFEAADPFADGSERLDTLRVLDLLDRAVARIDQEMEDDPRGKARLLHTLGKVYLNGGAPARGDSLLRQAVALRRTNGEPAAALGESLLFLGRAALEMGRPDDAEAPVREALALGEAVSPEDRGSLLVNLAVVHQERGEAEAADSLYRRALELFRSRPGSEHRQANVLTNLGALAFGRGDVETALPLTREALALHRAALPPDHPVVARSVNNLAMALRRSGDPAGAEPLFRESLEGLEERLRGPHPMLVIASLNLAGVLAELEQSEEAEARYREALSRTDDAFPPGHPDRALVMGNLAGFLVERGDESDLAEAEALASAAVGIALAANGPDHPGPAAARAVLAAAVAARGRTDEARELYGDALATLEATLPPDHPRIADVRSRLEELGPGD